MFYGGEKDFDGLWESLLSERGKLKNRLENDGTVDESESLIALMRQVSERPLAVKTPWKWKDGHQLKVGVRVWDPRQKSTLTGIQKNATAVLTPEAYYLILPKKPPGSLATIDVQEDTVENGCVMATVRENNGNSTEVSVTILDPTGNDLLPMDAFMRRIDNRGVGRAGGLRALLRACRSNGQWDAQRIRYEMNSWLQRPSRYLPPGRGNQPSHIPPFEDHQLPSLSYKIETGSPLHKTTFHSNGSDLTLTLRFPDDKEAIAGMTTSNWPCDNTGG